MPDEQAAAPDAAEIEPPAPAPAAEQDTADSVDGDDTVEHDADYWKRTAEEWRKRSEGNRAKVKKLGAVEKELDELRDAGRSEVERAVEAARRDERDRWQTKYRTQALHNAVLRVGGAKLADPTDALRLLELDPVDVVDDDGHIDDDAVRAAVDDLLARKPYLSSTTRRVPPSGDQGARPRPAARSLDSLSMSEYVKETRPGQWHGAG